MIRYLSLHLPAVALLFACIHASATASVTESKDIPYLSPQEATDPYRQERAILDIFAPAGAQNLPVVVWVHGGGLNSGDKTYIPAEIKNQAFILVTPSYRLLPRATLVNALEDTAAATAWVFKNIQNYGGDPKNIFLSGHSAGGYLSTIITLDRTWLAAHQIDANLIVGLIPFSAPMVSIPAFQQDPESAAIGPYAATSHVRADAPPVLFIVGDRAKDIPVIYGQNAEVLRRLKEAGHNDSQFVELPGTDHVTMQPPGVPLLNAEIKRVMDARAASR